MSNELVALLVGIVGAITAFLQWQNKKQIQELHILINSNLTKYVAAAVAAAIAETENEQLKREKDKPKS